MLARNRCQKDLMRTRIFTSVQTAAATGNINTGSAFCRKSTSEVYECDYHGGMSAEEFLRATSARNRKQNLWERAAWLWKYAPVVGCILALLLAASSRWPNGRYVPLHLVVCAVSVYWASESRIRERLVAEQSTDSSPIPKPIIRHCGSEIDLLRYAVESPKTGARCNGWLL
jgi:hypothetical protein